MYKAKKVITSIDQIRDVLGHVLYSQDTKVIDHIDALCQQWIERSTFVVVSTSSKAGKMDVAPKGDPIGAYLVLDKQTIAIPDRPGNNRIDSFTNILGNPRIGLMFIIPGRGEVVRVSGSAQVVTDPDLLERMAVGGKLPKFAILVRVEEAFFHCGKAIVRSGMWTPDKWASIEGLPTYGEALVAHGKLPDIAEEFQVNLERHERDTLY